MQVPTTYALGSASHTGHVRVNNEDDYLLGAIDPERGGMLFCAIADGMGGAAGGAEASRTALRALGSTVLDGASDLPLMARLTEGYRQAAQRVFEQAIAVPALRDMGTTLTAICFEAGRARIGHIGDTRLYRVRAGTAEAMTTDHAVREPENLLLRCVGGGQSSCEPDFVEIETAPGDRFVLVSDGVWSVLTFERLASLAARDGPQAAAEALVAAALGCGGPDNATAVVVDVLSTEPPMATASIELASDERPGARATWPRPRSLRPPLWPWLALFLALILSVVAALRWWGGIDVLTWLLQQI